MSDSTGLILIAAAAGAGYYMYTKKIGLFAPSSSPAPLAPQSIVTSNQNQVPVVQTQPPIQQTTTPPLQNNVNPIPGNPTSSPLPGLSPVYTPPVYQPFPGSTLPVLSPSQNPSYNPYSGSPPPASNTYSGPSKSELHDALAGWAQTLQYSPPFGTDRYGNVVLPVNNWVRQLNIYANTIFPESDNTTALLTFDQAWNTVLSPLLTNIGVAGLMGLGSFATRSAFAV